MQELKVGSWKVGSWKLEVGRLEGYEGWKVGRLEGWKNLLALLTCSPARPTRPATLQNLQLISTEVVGVGD